MSQLIPLTLAKIMQSRTYTVIILAAEDKKFAIYMEPQIGLHIQAYLAHSYSPRPSTYDLLSRILKELNVKLLQVIIHEVEENIYYAHLFAEQQIGDQKNNFRIGCPPKRLYHLSTAPSGSSLLPCSSLRKSYYNRKLILFLSSSF